MEVIGYRGRDGSGECVEVLVISRTRIRMPGEAARKMVMCISNSDQ